MHRKSKLALASIALTLAGAAAADAAPPELRLVAQPAERLERSIESHKAELRHADVAAEARRLGVGPERNAGAGDSTAELRRHTARLSDRIDAERRERRAERQRFELAPGVSQSTLDAIAACESGGDPTIVSSSGTYFGKYQFDTATWTSVGGSGNPAEASESEQDYRASLLYSRAGSSPWPVCG